MNQRLKRCYYQLKSRYKALDDSHNRACRELLNACWSALPGYGSQPWKAAELLVVDAEMSSLDWKQGEVLSLGWVVIRQQRVRLDSGRHLLLKPRQTVGDSAAIHLLRDCELESGLTEEEMLMNLLEAAKGRVLVFHHAPLDLAFLNRICQRVCGAPLLLPVVDTMELEKRQLERRDIPLKPNILRLASCRQRYNLPDYPAHNALMDALATAELLLAQVAHKGASLTLKSLISPGLN